MSINVFDSGGTPTAVDLSIKPSAAQPFIPIQSAFLQQNADGFTKIYERGVDLTGFDITTIPGYVGHIDFADPDNYWKTTSGDSGSVLTIPSDPLSTAIMGAQYDRIIGNNIYTVASNGASSAMGLVNGFFCMLGLDNSLFPVLPFVGTAGVTWPSKSIPVLNGTLCMFAAITERAGNTRFFSAESTQNTAGGDVSIESMTYRSAGATTVNANYDGSTITPNADETVNDVLKTRTLTVTRNGATGVVTTGWNGSERTTDNFTTVIPSGYFTDPDVVASAGIGGSYPGVAAGPYSPLNATAVHFYAFFTQPLSATNEAKLNAWIHLKRKFAPMTITRTQGAGVTYFTIDYGRPIDPTSNVTDGWTVGYYSNGGAAGTVNMTRGIAVTQVEVSGNTVILHVTGACPVGCKWSVNYKRTNSPAVGNVYQTPNSSWTTVGQVKDTSGVAAASFYGWLVDPAPTDPFTITIPDGSTNVQLHNLFVATYGSLTTPVNVTFAIPPGAIIGATGTHYALDTGAWPAGSNLTLIATAANIYGDGGDGANDQSGPGKPGGDALFANYPISIAISGGYIAGGGGGGGGDQTESIFYGGTGAGGTYKLSGGGGAGFQVGQGGSTPGTVAQQGSPGTASAFGVSAGGAPGSITGSTRLGGTLTTYSAGYGGALGQPGASGLGSGGSSGYSAGGAAGKSVSNLSNVTWIFPGTLLGPTA